MIFSDTMRGYNDIIILSLLQKQDSYGYEISQEIKDKTQGKYIVKETTLYSAFHRLVKLGYITSYEGDKTNGRKRTYYTITPEGLEFLKSKAKEWDVVKEVVDIFIKEVK